MNFSTTVIIPTYNGADKIEVVLKALAKQTQRRGGDCCGRWLKG